MASTTERFVDVTCVIPTHGRPHFLESAVESVAAQSALPSRLVIVSDDVDPESASFVASLSTSMVIDSQFVRREGVPGASASRNRGAAEATTEYLAFLDDDDLWTPDYLEAAMTVFEDRSVDAVVSSLYRFRDGSRLDESHPREGLNAEDVFRSSPTVTGSSLVIRREYFNKLGGYDPGLPVLNDTDFFLRFLSSGGTYAVIDSANVGVRKHSQGQLTDNSPRRIDGGWLFLKKHQADFPRAAARPRKYWQYRMMWRSKGASITVKAKALAGMAVNWSTAPNS
ncbi:glycosyltransferase family 2 protein [Subtercola sp. YIM 133946]|uniref:glycosyltransferase family 2 protein n=1 Tax=Subtercola sp. YIM 133946 TaxID=3118909 RepID=UPI002F94C7D2